MDKEQFEETLRTLLQREPFEPFEVQLNNGEIFTIVRPTVTFLDGSAGYLTPDDAGLQEFAFNQVRQMSLSAKVSV